MECSGNKNYSKAIIIIFIIAALYTVLPDLVPGPVDDASSVSGMHAGAGYN